jgi:hypothetical protein
LNCFGGVKAPGSATFLAFPNPQLRKPRSRRLPRQRTHSVSAHFFLVSGPAPTQAGKRPRSQHSGTAPVGSSDSAWALPTLSGLPRFFLYFTIIHVLIFLPLLDHHDRTSDVSRIYAEQGPYFSVIASFFSYLIVISPPT